MRRNCIPGASLSITVFFSYWRQSQKHYSLSCSCRRHFKPTPGLPERLQPDCIARRRGLRANVIRALYHTYDPFVERLVGLRGAVPDPHALRNLGSNTIDFSSAIKTARKSNLLEAYKSTFFSGRQIGK